MFQWISQNSATISAIANVAMVVVWVTYLQLFLSSHLRQRRSNILITRGAGSYTSARCFVSNMSAEPVYVQNIVATLYSGGDSWKAAVTDLDDLRESNVEYTREATNQGPLGVGEFRDLGSFEQLICRAASNAGLEVADISRDFDRFDLTVVAAYGPDKHSVAARRKFEVGEDGKLTPTTISSTQIRSARKRREIDSYLEDFI